MVIIFQSCPQSGCFGSKTTKNAHCEGIWRIRLSFEFAEVDPPPVLSMHEKRPNKPSHVLTICHALDIYFVGNVSWRLSLILGEFILDLGGCFSPGFDLRPRRPSIVGELFDISTKMDGLVNSVRNHFHIYPNRFQCGILLIILVWEVFLHLICVFEAEEHLCN